jgi:hypothetical protein
MTDEEALFAYIDGELEGEDLIRIEAKIAADPALQKTVAEHRAFAAELQRAFSTILDTPNPPLRPVTAAADGNVVSLADERSRRDRRPISWRAPHWAAMAATLVAGVIGGAVFSGSGRAGPVVEREGQLVASNWLADALTTQLASSQSSEARVRIGLTFRNHGGAICRSFAAESVEGVACRKGEEWQLKGLLSRERAKAGDYRLAGSADTAAIVDNMISGEAMDARQEKAAEAAGWQLQPGAIAQ